MALDSNMQFKNAKRDKGSVLSVQTEKSSDIKFSECQQTVAVASKLCKGNSPFIWFPQVHLTSV